MARIDDAASSLVFISVPLHTDRFHARPYEGLTYAVTLSSPVNMRNFDARNRTNAHLHIFCAENVPKNSAGETWRAPQRISSVHGANRNLRNGRCDAYEGEGGCGIVRVRHITALPEQRRSAVALGVWIFARSAMGARRNQTLNNPVS